MNVMKKSLIVLIIFIMCIGIACADISVGTIAISPTGDLVSGQNPPNTVTASYTIDFNPSGGETFSADNTLVMSTELENAQWSYTTILDGNANPAITVNGKNINLNGWVLSYPSKRELSIRVSLSGEVPTMNASGNMTVVRVAEIGSKGSVVSGSEVIKTRYVTNPADKSKAIADVKAQLVTLRSAIDDKASQGVDTTEAMQKFSDANTAIQNADKATSFTTSQSFLNTAIAALKDGQTALDKATVQKTITEAQRPIDQTDDLITYFKVNRSMSKDSRLAPIIETRDRAADLISQANDLVSKGDFVNAKDKALQASDKGKEAYNSALTLRKDIGEANPLDSVGKMFGGIGGGIGGIGSGIAGALIYIVIIVVIAVIVVVAIILYRRRRDWDELA
jgi:cell fate (sporulation/competence/biofilm development) regulator YlbF (YheA/YmcA/DUF963 family)